MTVPTITLVENENIGDYHLIVENWETKKKFIFPISVRKVNKFSRLMAFLDGDVEKNFYLIYILEFFRRKYDSFIQVVNTFHYEKVVIYSSYTKTMFNALDDLTSISINFDPRRINIYRRLIKSWTHHRFARVERMIRNENISGLKDLPIRSKPIKPIIKTYNFYENLHPKTSLNEFIIKLRDSRLVFRISPQHENYFELEPKFNFRSISAIEIAKEVFMKKYVDYFQSKRKRAMSKPEFITNYQFIIYQ